MVRVQYAVPNQMQGQGGGSIISHRHILTSAFVLGNNQGTLNVFIGGVTRTTQRAVQVQARLPHPGYQVNPRTNDIGLILLAMDIIFDRFVQPIALPSIGDFGPWDNEQGTALGFGGFPGQTNLGLFGYQKHYFFFN